MFDDYKTGRYFAKIILDLGPRTGKKFSKLVRALYENKILSDEDLPTYKITTDDLDSLLTQMNNHAKRA